MASRSSRANSVRGRSRRRFPIIVHGLGSDRTGRRSCGRDRDRVSTNGPAELSPLSVIDASTLADSDVNAIVAINDKLGYRIVGAGIERQEDLRLPAGQPIE